MNSNAIKFFINPEKILKLIKVNLSDQELRMMMGEHYSCPKGFVGKRIIYGITYAGKNYGFIAGGSPTLYLPGRNEYFGITKQELNYKIVNNNFYHIEKIDNRYPLSNFTVRVISEWRKRIQEDWKKQYGDDIVGYESLVELPRIGEIYRRDKWDLVGQTKGFTCKRIGGKGSDSWGGKKVWSKNTLRPKLVFCKKV